MQQWHHTETGRHSAQARPAMGPRKVLHKTGHRQPRSHLRHTTVCTARTQWRHWPRQELGQPCRHPQAQPRAQQKTSPILRQAGLRSAQGPLRLLRRGCARRRLTALQLQGSW